MIGQQAIVDAYLCLVHLTAGILVGKFWNKCLGFSYNHLNNFNKLFPRWNFHLRFKFRLLLLFSFKKSFLEFSSVCYRFLKNWEYEGKIKKNSSNENLFSSFSWKSFLITVFSFKKVIFIVVNKHKITSYSFKENLYKLSLNYWISKSPFYIS